MVELFKNKIKKLYLTESTIIDDDGSILIDKGMSSFDLANKEYQIESAKNSVQFAWSYLYNEKKPRGFKLVSHKLFDNHLVFQQIENMHKPGKYVSDVIAQILINDAWDKNITIEKNGYEYKISTMLESIGRHKDQNNFSNLKEAMQYAIDNYDKLFIKTPFTLSKEDTQSLCDAIINNPFIYEFINNPKNQISTITNFAMTKDGGLAMIRYYTGGQFYEFTTIIVATGKINYFKYLEEDKNKNNNDITPTDIKNVFKKYKISYLYMTNFKQLTLDTDFIKKDKNFGSNNSYHTNFGEAYRNIIINSFNQPDKYLRYYALFPFNYTETGKNIGHPIISNNLYKYYMKVNGLAKNENFADKDSKGWKKYGSSMCLVLLGTTPSISFKCTQENCQILYQFYYPKREKFKECFSDEEYNNILKEIYPFYDSYAEKWNNIGILTVEIFKA